MEGLKKTRGPLRSGFTRIANSLTESLLVETIEAEEIAILLTQLNEKWVKLAITDNKILELLQNTEGSKQEEFDTEYEATETYSERYLSVKTRAERFLAKEQAESSSVTETASKRKFRLPKIELKKFSGDIKEWIGFWGQFRKIHEDTQIDLEDKFQYLSQATVAGSRARDLVDSFPPTAANYPQLIDCMKSRFGRDEILVEVYVRELLNLVLSNSINQRKTVSLPQLYDKVEAHLRSLETLGVTSDKYAAMLYPLVESCLPEDIIRVWERSISSTGGSAEEIIRKTNKLTSLMNFLKAEVEGEQRISLARSSFGIETKNKSKLYHEKSKSENEGEKPIPTAAGLFTAIGDNRQKICIFCDKPHWGQDCRTAFKWTLEEKKRILCKKRCCYICLRAGHLAKFCKLKPRCRNCQKRHYELMCPENSIVDLVESEANKNEEKGGIERVNVLANRACAKEVLLQTLTVVLRKGNKSWEVRALIDTGSQKSYITQEAAAKMQYAVIDERAITHTLFSGVESQQKHSRYHIKVSNMSRNYHCSFDVLDQGKICAEIPRIPEGPWLEEVGRKKIVLSDWASQGDKTPYEIHLLIGADIAGKLLTGNVEKLTCGLVAVETLLGWTLMGKVEMEGDKQHSMLTVLSLHVHNTKLEDLWTLDSLGILDPAGSQDGESLEEEAQKHFHDTIEQDSSGRYVVRLPWVEKHPALPTNRAVAERRLRYTVKKLQEQKLLADYEEIFQDWEKEEIIEMVEENEERKGNCHYLPHRVVVKEGATTRLRPVFDASAKGKGAVSLNDCLVKGPNLVEQIPAVLSRFRMNRIGVTADIRKAFLQIELHERDRDYLRFLWWEEGDPKRQRVFRHRRVVFGVSSSPFLLAATISYHLERVPAHLEETARRLRDSMYVDNCLTSIENVEELQRFICEAREIMSLAKFDLRGWTHNSLQPTQPLEVGGNEVKGNKTLSEPSDQDTTISVLGLLWDRKRDSLKCDLKEIIQNDKSPVTKRHILSVAHRVFDPIGFSCPVTLIPKLILQECWKLKVTWDTELPQPMVERFQKWKKGLHLLALIEIPRHIMVDSGVGLTLHTFCDASQLAYGACVFLRGIKEGTVFCHLVAARSRVAPLKPLTIPRLELMACCIGVRLCNSFSKDLLTVELPAFYWTDSMDTLYWIKSSDRWGSFVHNRVTEIRSKSSPTNWNHVPGKINPADLPSRGCSPATLLATRWWEGPEWLHGEPEVWPKADVTPDKEIVESERKRAIVAMSSSANCEFYHNISSFLKIVRVTGWILRFCKNARMKKDTRSFTDLTTGEMKEAELRLFKIAQREVFQDIKEKRLRPFRPFCDAQGIIRTKTRLLLRDDTEEFKNPIILPSDHPIVSKLIMWSHVRFSHCGVQTLMSILREKFWIIRGRRTIKKVVGQCVRCRRFMAQQVETQTPPLPEDRVREANVFEVIGIDLAGPLVLKDGQKTWIVLFTCAVFRAVHLELVSSLTSDCFLLALRRFIARRGRPLIIYSDNGTNLVGASSALKKLEWKKLMSEDALYGICWKFIPPAAPWWGGWWERLVGMIKQILRKVLGRASLLYEELYTVLCDCESVINSRPITYVSESVDDLEPLTPAMFLQEIKATGVPDLDHLETIDMSRRYRYRQKIREDLRKRFRVEYLGHLRQNAAHLRNRQAVAVGDVVLVDSANTKRLYWPLAVITEIFPGKDGIVRVVKLKTATGEQLRPVQRLYPLEVCAAGAEHLRGKIRATQPPEELLDCQAKTHEAAAQGLVDEEVSRETVATKAIITRAGRSVKVPQRLDI